MITKTKSKMDQKERFIELRAEGRSYADIAAALNVSKPTLIEWSRDLQDELTRARTLRMDILFEKYAVAKAKRVEVFGKRLNAILEELEGRDLKEVRTDALLRLALLYGDHLKEEDSDLRFWWEEVPLGMDWNNMTSKRNWLA
jgi:transposase